ncbi:uncharacterized protein ColSpa_12542 [Colletotrichum spaethianum]|uniref:Uncharacterized protein n=1 Tax=Colletotrichum spaethianum TaxID=700344 RepID=A0AA37PHE4_9PEZI|nr:uncharacterized protein ColSpa_12542 [Colletotrichum spaethianum]GKT52361.1 hypothetical protein ColSpa_12542 [Colletotrichum spaethianum]
MALDMGSELQHKAGGKSEACVLDESEAQTQGQELYDAWQVLDDMVEQTCMSLTAGTVTAHREMGERRPVPDNSRYVEPQVKVYAPCPTCRAEVGLELNENGILSIPVVIATEKHLVHLRNWARWRRAEDDELLAQGLPLPETACPWRRVAIGTTARYKTRSEEEAEDDKNWLSDEESEEDEPEDEAETYRTRPQDETRWTLTADDAVAHDNRVPGGRPPVVRLMASSPASHGWGPGDAPPIPVAEAASSPRAGPSQAPSYPNRGFGPFSGGWPAPGSSTFSNRLLIPMVIHRHPPRMRSRPRGDESFVDGSNEEEVRATLAMVSKWRSAS